MKPSEEKMERGGGWGEGEGWRIVRQNFSTISPSFFLCVRSFALRSMDYFYMITVIWKESPAQFQSSSTRYWVKHIFMREVAALRDLVNCTKGDNKPVPDGT